MFIVMTDTQHALQELSREGLATFSKRDPEGRVRGKNLRVIDFS